MKVVSIIITTKNEQQNIRDCLISIKNQAFPKSKIEIIVVDNYSIDGTKNIVQNLKGLTVNFLSHGPERSAQRNFGVNKSQGKYILYLDADMRLSPGVINECVKKIKTYVALYIPEIIIGNNLWSKVRNFERSFYQGTPIDAVRFIRSDIFLKTGGFDEKLTGPEDWDLDKRIREMGKVGMINSPLYHQESDLTLLDLLNKKSYYAADIKKYINKWGVGDADIKKQLGFVYRYWTVFTEGEKWKKLVFHPVLAVEMYLVKFLTGIILLLSMVRSE